MSKPASTKVHASIDQGRSLCGHGKSDAIKPFSGFFVVPEADQCASCLKKIDSRGYSLDALRKRYTGLATPAPAAVPVAKPARRSEKPSLFDEAKKTAVALLDKTIAQIERNRIEINRFEKLCEQLRERGFEFAHKVTPHPYAIHYSIKLDLAQTARLSELLNALAGMGYTDHDPAFPNITGMRALEITGPDAPVFTLHYTRQARPALGTLAHTLALRKLEDTHAYRND